MGSIFCISSETKEKIPEGSVYSTVIHREVNHTEIGYECGCSDL